MEKIAMLSTIGAYSLKLGDQWLSFWNIAEIQAKQEL